MNHEKSLIVLYCKCLLRISYLRKNIYSYVKKRYAKALISLFFVPFFWHIYLNYSL